MTLALAAVLLILVVFWMARSRKKLAAEPAYDSTATVDRWLRSSLEIELAEGVLGLRRSTPEERRSLVKTLAHEPDAAIVSAIEETVRGVDIEWVRYAHDADVEATMHVRYEDGTTGKTTRRFPEDDVPKSVLADFTSKGGTRVFRSWSFPWQRTSSL